VGGSSATDRVCSRFSPASARRGDAFNRSRIATDICVPLRDQRKPEAAHNEFVSAAIVTGLSA